MVCNSHSNLCITFVIAGNFDQTITSGLILFILQLKLKRTERNKTIRNEWKHDHSWASAEILPGGNVNILFIIFKLLTISDPSKIILRWTNIWFSEYDYFSDE